MTIDIPPSSSSSSSSSSSIYIKPNQASTPSHYHHLHTLLHRFARMAGVRRVAALIFCLVCFLHSGSGTRMAFAAERKLLVEQSWMSTNESSLSSPTDVAAYKTEITTWCVVKPSTSQEKMDEIIGYCCIQEGVDCSVIQPGGMCYFPPNKVSDASVVMNIFYRLKGKQPFDCSFNGSGLIVTGDPSVDECVYPA